MLSNVIMLMKSFLGWTIVPSALSNSSSALESNSSGTIVSVNQVQSSVSTDNGITWSNTSVIGSGIVYGGGQFVCVAPTYAFSSVSTDGITWATGTAPSGLRDVTFGASKYVAIGTNICYTSTDGLSWTSRTIGSLPWSKITFDGTNFVALQLSSNQYATSPDGITWTIRALSITGTPVSLVSGNGIIACAYAIAGTTYAIYSIDNGLSFVTGNVSPISGNQGISFGNGKFLIVGFNSTYSTSSDFISFSTPLSLPISSTKCGYTGDRFIAAKMSGTDIAYSSGI